MAFQMQVQACLSCSAAHAGLTEWLNCCRYHQVAALHLSVVVTRLVLVESTALQIVHPAHRPVSPAVEDPFQLEGLEERAPPLPEDEAPVASTAAADDAEPRNGVSKSSQDAHQAEVGWPPPDGAYASHAAQIAICVLEAVHCTGHALILPTLALQ